MCFRHANPPTDSELCYMGTGVMIAFEVVLSNPGLDPVVLLNTLLHDGMVEGGAVDLEAARPARR